jgi:hypothetical protein
MVGTILAYASITLNGGTLNGRALAVGGGNGAVTIAAAEAITVSAGSGSPLTTVYTAAPFTFPPSLSGNFTVSGFDIAGNNGTFAIQSNTSSQLILFNSNGSPTIDYAAGSPPVAAATQIAVAVQAAAKALQVQSGAVLADGIVIAIDPIIPEVEVSGPPSGVYGNVQYMLPLLLQLAGVTEATASQPYTFLTHNDSAALGWVQGTDIGVISTTTRPYIVGEVVGLNPRQPYYNSPYVPSITPNPAPSDAPWSATMPATVGGKANGLPPGLSLDANTGLIYGTLTGTVSPTFTSVIQYTGATGIVHGVLTITWNTVASAFALIDNIQDGISLGTMLTGTTSSPTMYITVPAGVTPISASVYYARGVLSGTLPAGLVLSSTADINGNFYITGSATESGYFDVWFQVIANTGIAYLHHRLSVNFAAPLTIVSTSLPNISALFYDTQLQGFGGQPSYTWSAVFPAGAAGLSISASGLITGTLSSPPGSSPTDLGNVAVTLTDQRGPSSAVTVQLDLTYNNNLSITTPSLGIATVTDDPNGYAFQMQAASGTPPYTWNLVTGTLPTGITLSSSGLLSGTYAGALGGSYPVNISVTDFVSTVVSRNFTVTTGVLTGSINDSGVGLIPRGAAYQGTLVATLCMIPPIQWQVAPTTGYPNLLPSGLALQANGAGATATIAGTYPLPPSLIAPILVDYPVRVVAVDSLGDTAEIILELSTDTNLVIIGWDTVPASGTVQSFPLPNAVITANYGPIQLVAINGVPVVVDGVDGGAYNQYNWSSVPTFPFNGLSLSGSGSTAGQISGAASTRFTQSFVFTVSDNLTPPNTAQITTTLSSQTSSLTITTASLPSAAAGVPYSAPLTETGAQGTPTWSIVGGALPSGLSLSSTTGSTIQIVGTTIQVGPASITFRVTDVGGPNNGAYFNKTLTLTVASGLTLQTGIDYTDSTTYNILGYVDKGNVVSISPRPNLSFYVVATKVVSTSPSGLTIVAPAGFTATVVSLTGPSGNAVAQIQVTGPFSSGTLGNNNFSISVTDSGVTKTGTFIWVVYDDGALRLAPQTGSFPVKLTTPN